MPLPLELKQEGPSPRIESAADIIRAGFGEPKGATKHLDLAIPLTELGMRLGPIDRDLFDEIQQSNDRDGNLDFIAASCQCILVKDERGKWRPADIDGVPVRFDGSFSAAMGQEVSGPREEVLLAFGQAPMPHLAIADHAFLVREWLAGRAEQREEEMLGES